MLYVSPITSKIHYTYINHMEILFLSFLFSPSLSLSLSLSLFLSLFLLQILFTQQFYTDTHSFTPTTWRTAEIYLEKTDAENKRHYYGRQQYLHEFTLRWPTAKIRQEDLINIVIMFHRRLHLSDLIVARLLSILPQDSDIFQTSPIT